MSLEKKDAILFGDGDELPSNHSNNPHMNDLIAGLGRRQVLAGGAALGALAFLGVALPASAAPAEAQAPAAEGLRGLPFKR
nr:Tat pathway signal protein [Pseudomonas aeruginosa]